jgi:DNA polymerase bacteriophage-type
MPVRLHHDYETRSEIDLPARGLHNYAAHPSTQILMESWAVDDGKVHLWLPHESPMPNELRDALTDPHVIKTAWNSTFEQYITAKLLGMEIPFEQWDDVMIHARHLSMPGSLASVGKILGLKEIPASAINDRPSMFEEQEDAPPSTSEAKIGDGERLIKLFCEPAYLGGKDTLFGPSQTVFRDWRTHPHEWERFCEYCRQDTVAERTLLKKMSLFPLPEVEQRGWVLDQKINATGLPVDRILVENAIDFTNRAQAELRGKLHEITELDNPNSRDQLLAWARSRGYPFNSLRKDWVNRALVENLSPEVREALELRKQLAKTGAKKYAAILELMGADNRLRHQYSFLGAARTGRWASNGGVNVQNLSRSTKEVEQKIELAIELVRSGDYDTANREFPSIMDLVNTLVRSAFRAPGGHKLVVCDLNAIENRVIGWLSGCESILDVFREGRDPYLDFASHLYNESYEQLLAEYKAGNKEKRNNSKPGVLGCGFGLGGGELITNSEGDEIKTGLWAYAENMGVNISREEAHLSVKVFRDMYPDVVRFWYDLEKAYTSVLRTGKPTQVGHLGFSKTKKVLQITLPSGRRLSYLNPKMEDRDFFGKTKKTLIYDGVDQQTKQWTRIETRGSKVCENVTQAVARDLLLHGMLLANECGFNIVGSTHDEIISLQRDEDLVFLGMEELRGCMVQRPNWAPDLPLGAEGFVGEYYKK